MHPFWEGKNAWTKSEYGPCSVIFFKILEIKKFIFPCDTDGFIPNIIQYSPVFVLSQPVLVHMTCSCIYQLATLKIAVPQPLARRGRRLANFLVTPVLCPKVLFTVKGLFSRLFSRDCLGSRNALTLDNLHPKSNYDENSSSASFSGCTKSPMQMISPPFMNTHPFIFATAGKRDFLEKSAVI